MPKTLPLVCPACHNSVVLQSTGQPFLNCGSPGCDSRYPIVGGVPILIQNWVDYARSERWIILRRHDLHPEIDALLDEPLGDEQPERIRRKNLATYMRSHFGEAPEELADLSRMLPQWVREWLPASAQVGLDAGCATGGFTAMLAERVHQAAGIDLHFERVHAAAQRVHNATFLVASAEEPPFKLESIGVILALNLIDSVFHPRLTLENLRDCLEPGGLLLLTTPFEYTTINAPRSEWLDGQALHAMLAADFDILDDRERLPWILPASDRHADIFFVRAIAARKRSTS